MSLTDIKTKSQGFTIVELLIVVVVIAILAAITIVSYNGITNKAHSSAAQASAATLQKKIGLYQSDKGTYPTSLSVLTAGTSNDSWAVPTGTVELGTATPSSSYKEKTVQVLPCIQSSDVKGFKLQYYTWNGSAPTGELTIGDTSTGCAASGSGWTS